MSTVAPEPRAELLTLPEVSQRIGVSLDKLRKVVRSHLEPRGLVKKVGSTWIATVDNVPAIAEAVRS